MAAQTTSGGADSKRISAPVGLADRGNQPSDVRLVQQLLNSAEGRQVVDVTGRVEARAKPSSRDPRSLVLSLRGSTISAIEDFQRRVVGLERPDGRVDPGGLTMAKLVNPGKGPYFPISVNPRQNYKESPRCFGAGRGTKNGKYTRAHAGCDLYAPVGTPIYAVADGEVVANPRYFYDGTNQLSVFHPSLNLTLRYGEIQIGSTGSLRKTSKVLAGQRIARVGKMKKHRTSMLHLEAYSGRARPCRVKGAGKKIAVVGWASKIDDTELVSERLEKLVDPTWRLDRWKANKPTQYF